MGCCMSAVEDIKFQKLVIEEDLSRRNNSDSFDDINLSSNSDIIPINDWIDYKDKAVTEPTANCQSINSLTLKSSTLKLSSIKGSLIDSFSVTLPLPKY